VVAENRLDEGSLPREAVEERLVGPVERKGGSYAVLGFEQ
jgi:hypothetical protein